MKKQKKFERMKCIMLCNRSFCCEHECLYMPSNAETNRIVFEEHTKVLREFSDSGQLVTDLFMLIKKHNKLKKQAEVDLEYSKLFDRLNPKVWDMNGNLISNT